MKGRKPIPSRLHIARGTARSDHRPPPPTIASDRAVVIASPPELSPIASAEWDRVAPLLYELGLLTPLDRSALAAYCEAWDLYRQAVTEVNRDGMTVPTETGDGRKMHPALRAIKDAQQQMRVLAVEFGMTPSSRGRIEIPNPPKSEEDDPW